MVDVPAVVRRKAEVAGQQRWLDDLDALVADLADRWRLSIGDVYDGGTEALVLAAERLDGTPAVLKLLVPRADEVALHEIAVLRHAGGDGCVRLLEADDSLGALLLERLGPSMHDLGLPHGQRLHLLADLARQVWRPAADLGLPTGGQKATWLVEHITTTWEALDRPCSERVVDHALTCAERRRAAHDDERAVLVHGDIHQWNALRRGDGWALVDPDGLLAEPEYDVGVLLREDPDELLAGDPLAIAGRLAERCGVDVEAAWEWGVVERVSTALVCEQVGLQPVGRQMFAAAEAVAPSVRSAGFAGGAVRRSDVVVRPATPEDLPFLERMLAAAADWRPRAAARSVDEVLADPGVGHYVAGWPRPGDLGVVAEDHAAAPLGAAWCRLLPPDDPGYGFVAADVPEVAIGVVPGARGRGIGRRLMVALAAAARAAGVERLSLSVEVVNPAIRLYEELGYVVVSEADGSATMVLDLR